MSNLPNSGPPRRYVLKSDAGVEDVTAAVRIIEDAADKCYKPLALLRMPANIAIWSLLTCLITEITEKHLNGPTNHELTNSISNASRAIATAINWASRYGRSPSHLVSAKWTPGTRRAALEALSQAHQYQSFRNCLPMWHRSRFSVAVENPSLAVFQMHEDGTRPRQVSAYQKGHRPPTGKKAAWFGIPQTPESTALYDDVLNHANSPKKGSLSYGNPLKLWNSLLPSYLDRVNLITRRSPSLELGGYTLSDFSGCYAAIASISAAHEFLCFKWGQRSQQYPADSAVQIRFKHDWIKIIASLSGVPKEKTSAIVDDLVFDIESSDDLVAQPFVPLGIGSPRLAVAPPFPLSSRMDENLLRTLTKSRTSVSSQANLSKESELRAHLQTQCPQFTPRGPRSMPKPLPDIDLILSDESSSTAVFCEAKWLRMATTAGARLSRDEELSKGFDQLAAIQTYLTANPQHLKTLKALPRSFNEYKNVHFIVLARDHWFWREPKNRIAVLEFEAFVQIIRDASDLGVAMEELLRYDWLPVEGRDFEVTGELATAGGVSIKSPTFWGLPRQRISIPRN
jgi:hypothetical protein